MNTQEHQKRLTAVKTADAINTIEGNPVSEYARELSHKWVSGEITGEQMKASLLEYHRKLAKRI